MLRLSDRLSRREEPRVAGRWSGREVTLFDYPYGQVDDFDADAERAIEWAGFTAACSTQFGRGSAACQRFRLCRVGVEADDSLADLERGRSAARTCIAPPA
jgi:hypothetical protein